MPTLLLSILPVSRRWVFMGSNNQQHSLNFLGTSFPSEKNQFCTARPYILQNLLARNCGVRSSPACLRFSSFFSILTTHVQTPIYIFTNIYYIFGGNLEITKKRYFHVDTIFELMKAANPSSHMCSSSWHLIISSRWLRRRNRNP